MSISIAQMDPSFIAGSLTTLSPCVFSVLPLVVGGAMQTNRLAAVAIGVGMVASFALIGLLAWARRSRQYTQDRFRGSDYLDGCGDFAWGR